MIAEPACTKSNEDQEEDRFMEDLVMVLAFHPGADYFFLLVMRTVAVSPNP